MGMIEGVVAYPLTARADERGSLTELFRMGWQRDLRFQQWNLERSQAGVLRGMQVHRHRSDCFVLVEGVATVGLCDLRDDSASAGCTFSLRVAASTLALLIPPGVGHGFFFHTEAAHLNGLTNEWDPDDDGRFHWSDRSTGIDWPVSTPIISPRDAAAPDLSTLLDSGWSLS